MRARSLVWAVVGSFCVAVCGLALAGTPALAGSSAPEAPVTEAASEVGGFSAVLHGELKPGGGASGYYFAYNAGPSCEGGATTEPGTADSGQVQSEASGLLPLTNYTFCLVATNENGSTFGPGVSFETKRVAPAVEGESFLDVGSSSAQLNAEVNAENVSSEYSFEYATGAEYTASAKYGSVTPAASFGSGHEAVGAPAQLTGLAPGTEYDFRVAVRNTSGEVTRGQNVKFSTLPIGVLNLPDGRVFERVSPVDDGQSEVYTPDAFGLELPRSEGVFAEYHAGGTANEFAVSVDGDGVVYPGAATGGGKSESNDYLATRLPGGGWQQVDIEPAGRFGAGYFAFSSDLSVGILRALSEHAGVEEGLPPLSPEAPGHGYDIFYKHGLEGERYEPFITKADSLHRTPEGPSQLRIVFEGAPADFSQVFFGANDALTSDAIEVEHDQYDRYNPENLYDMAEGQLSLVNVLPNGSSEPSAVFGAPCISHDNGPFCFEPDAGRPEQEQGGESADLSRAVSVDGSRAFWTDLDTGNLYVREDPASSDAKTVQVNAAIGGAARFWTASADGSKVFFTKGLRTYVGEEDGELYEYELETGRTTDLTPGVEVAGVIGASEDGEYLYYVDSHDNLNLWHDGTSTFIARLSEADGGEEIEPIAPYAGATGDWYTSLGKRTAEVTPDGRGLVFMSSQSLKAEGYPSGYHNEGREEVYAYEAEDGGRLFCVSCSRSGEAPPVGAYGVAAFVPVSWEHTEQLKWISDDGSRVFFDSAEPLVPQDTNGKLDVYEWERDGTGSCQESMGCVYLLSGGQSGSSSWLVGTSASGDDVFIASRAPLVPGDPYDSFAVYDARVGGAQPLASPVCTGTGCQGLPPAPPIFATPASVTFNGVGNFSPSSTVGSGKAQAKAKGKARSLTRTQKLESALKACRKKRGHARSACRVRARRRYALKPAGKSSIREGK
jgi:hypothetical protein